MRTVKHDFFDKFQCIADKCPCTCCSGWQIMIDEASLERFKDYKGPIEKNLKNSIDWEESAIYQCENGDCAFLNENKLCDLIIAEGDGILCDTCRLYPRHVEEYEDLREWAMSLSCPEVARMVVEGKDMTGLVVNEDDEPDPLEDDFEDFDFIFFTKLQDSREVIFKILKDNTLSMAERMGLILELSYRLQCSYDSDEIFEMDDTIEEFSNDEFIKNNAEEFNLSFSGFIREDFKVYDELERLSEDFDDWLSLIDFYPYSEGDRIHDFLEGMDEERHNEILTNLFFILIYTYYLGAVYNGMVFAYTQMCIFLVISMDSLGLSLSKKLGRKITPTEYQEMVYRISRETEHSDININTMLEYFDVEE